MSYVIEIHNIKKMYRLNEESTSSLRDYISSKTRKMVSKKRKHEQNEFWALNGISFNVGEGQVVGVIGRNGAGKSTLLKILSRITLPTSGQIKIKGRLSSLLEVGTGFHPDLSGRENIYLNGSILGMSRQEINNKFDEIVEFSGVEKFLDTPVKHYSSGMYVRLAFAVSAHLEPDILVIDEVLAVGDAEFQKKCLGKMKEVTGKGRTVLFVSHNMTAVKSLCDKVAVLKNGMLDFYGDTDTAIKHYIGFQNAGFNHQLIWNTEDAPADENIRILSMKACAKGKTEDTAISADDDIEFTIRYKKLHSYGYYHITLQFANEENQVIFNTSIQEELNDALKNEPEGEYLISCTIPAPFFNPGSFYINVHLTANKRKVEKRFGTLMVLQIIEGKREIGASLHYGKGLLRPSFTWVKDKIKN